MPRVESPAVNQKELKILILEDAPGDAKKLEMELQDEGLTFTATRVDSREAFQQELSQSPPDLILADYNLPAFCGLEVLREAQGKCPDVPMIFVSGCIEEEEALEVVKMGATDYVLKNRLNRLVPAVRRAVQESEDRRRRRQAELELERSLFRNKLILEAAGEGIITLDQAGRITFANPAALRMLEAAPGELLGKPLKTIAPRLKLEGGGRRGFSLHFALLPEGGVNPEGEFLRRNGQRFLAELTLEPLIENGAAAGAVLTFSDISARKQAEEARQKSEATLRAVFQGSGIGIALVDRQGRLAITNPALQGMLGYTEEELAGMALADLIHPEDMAGSLAVFQALQEGKENRRQLEGRYVRKDGEVVWGRLTASVITDAQGAFQFAAGMIEDITERKRAREALRESEERFTLFMQHLPGAAVMRDLRGRYLYANKGWEDAFQKTPADWSGKSLEEVWPQQAARQFRADDQALIASGKPHKKVRKLLHPDGQEHYWLLTRFPIPGKDGKPELIGALGLDITDHRKSEQQAEQHLLSLNLLLAGVGKLAKTRHPDGIIQEICQLVVEAFDARLVWLGRAEPEGSVRPVWWAGDAADYLKEIEVRWDDTPQGQGPTGQAIRSGQPVVFHDLAAEAAFAPWRDAALARGYRTCAAIPLSSDHQAFGALMVYSERADFFPSQRVELLQAYARIAATVLENARLDKQAERRLRQLDALRIVDLAAIGSLDLRVTLNVFLDQLTRQLGADAALVLLLNSETRTLEYAADRGFLVKGLKKIKLALSQGLAGRVVREQRLLHIPSLAEAGSDFALARVLAPERFQSCYVVPLLGKGQVNGVLEIFNRTPFNDDAEWLEFLVDLAGQAAIAIDNDALFNGLQRSHAEMVQAYEATLEGWAKALELRDDETKGHSERVVELTLRTARALGVPEEELVHFRRGALLHDIGKICVPDQILLKAGPLTEEEWAVMRLHPIYAYQWLSPISYLEPALAIPYCHHERWDGTGYPRGLKGEAIPLAARIFAVVDVWEALTSDRPYRRAWPREKAIAHIRKQSGKHFDPKVAEIFLQQVSGEDHLALKEQEKGPGPQMDPR